MIYLFLFIGILTLNLLRLNESWKSPNFNWKTFLKENIIPAIVVMIIGFVVISNPEPAESYINRVLPSLGFAVNGFTMALFGITGDVILKKIITLFDPDKKTVIGLNN